MMTKQLSVAQFKAHVSEVLADTQHHGCRTVILKHGKAIAEIGPVTKRPAPPPPTKEDVEARLRAFNESLADMAKYDDGISAVADLKAGRDV